MSRSRTAFKRQLRQLGFDSYDAYLRSPHWYRTRRAYRCSGLTQTCYCCGEYETALHHKTYERLGSELFADLVPLCQRCHALAHVLERRGDIALDLTGLMDATRAARNSVLEQERRKTAEADFGEARDQSKILVDSLCRRLKQFFSDPYGSRDPDELHAIAEGVGELGRLIRERT